MRWRYGRAVTVVVIIIADQWSKWLVVTSTLAQQPIIVMPFLRLVYAENTGAAFSLLANTGEGGRWALVGASLLISAILMIWLWHTTKAVEAAALAFILGGAVGNVIDRLRWGYVVDFIDIHLSVYHWPAFNIADSSITVGAVLLMWTALFAKRQ